LRRAQRHPSTGVAMPLDFLSPLHRASRGISVYLEGRTRELGVSPGEGHLLTYLRGYAPAPVGELVRVFGLKQSTLTSMLDRLEAAGLLRREVNPEDRRSYLIHLTGAGEALAERLNALLQTLEADIRMHVSPAEVEGFRAVMAAVEAVTRVQLRER
jgi:DNA-binding MarR family transcriptional regulator